MPAQQTTLAQQLLDAQVAYHLDQLRGTLLTGNVAVLTDELLDAVGQHQIADLVDRAAIKEIVARGLVTLPRSAAVRGIVEVVLDVLAEGPTEPSALGDVVDRDQVAELVDALLAMSPVVDRALSRLADSPLVGMVATRFMGRIVGEVLQANKAVADKVPGLGSLMSFGTSTAAKMMGAADRQFEGLLGDTVGKGGAFAVRRLSRIIIETMQDPTTREAVLQAWDVVAAEPIKGIGATVLRDEIAALVDAGHDLTATALGSEQVAQLAAALVDGFFDHFGGYTPTELLEQLDVDRGQVRDDVVGLAPAVITLLDATGDLERLVRARLAPFYDSAEVAALLN